MLKPIPVNKFMIALKAKLDEGWGINYARSLAGISQNRHTKLLRFPEYKALVDMYKKTSNDRKLVKDFPQ